MAQVKSQSQRTAEFFEDLWQRIIPNRWHDVILPESLESILFDGEEARLVIYQAWYRNASAFLFYNYGLLVLLVTILLSLLIGLLNVDLRLFADRTANMLIPPMLALIWLLYGLFENFQYLKSRLIVTNRRIILAIPQRDDWYLTDTIELTGKPQVIDANWSNNRGLRIMQIISGARDLAISLQGLQFVAGTAQVRDALVIQDVELEQIRELKRIYL
ncbi:MAG: hypothetical protein AAF633_18590 [Chloroflexota bacterium]